MFHLTVERTICVAHGPDERLHGHNWVVRATVSASALGPDGRLLPPAALQDLLWGVVEPIDHRRLEDLAPFEELPPTAHGVAAFTATALQPLVAPLVVTRVDVSDGEVCSSWTADRTAEGV